MLLAAAGLLDVGFALFHALFWRLFGWPARLAPAGGLNSAITRTLNAVLIFVFAVYGAALLWHPGGSWLLPLAGAGFWTLRLVLQFLWFDLKPWPSKLIAAVFALAAAVHLLAALS